MQILITRMRALAKQLYEYLQQATPMLSNTYIQTITNQHKHPQKQH